ncbi:Ulp1 protease family, C-terminal catalytic domain [Sesbania bispinosa]|nr:Ulp1 protease family, C-terminal catalytic domain [Sesbania bispinosa]
MDSTSKVRVRNACEMKFLKQINNELTTVQRDRVRGTPFGCTLEVPPEMQISGPLLLELTSRWCERSGGFRIRGVIVPFTPLEVCVALGLCILGKKLWAMDHLCMWPRGSPSTVNRYPRIRSWENLKRDRKGIASLFNTNQVAIEVGVTNDEVEEYSVLKEAMYEAECGFRNCKFRNMDLDEIRRENVALRESNKKQEERISHLEQEVGELRKILVERGLDARTCERKGCLVQTYGCPITPEVPNHDGVPARSCERHSGHGRPMSTPTTSHKDLLRQLYVYCVYGDQSLDETVIKLFSVYLNRQDLNTMKPRGWVSNMVFLLAPKLFMAHELGSKGHLSRYMFTSRLVESFDTGHQKRWTCRSVRDLIDDSTSIDQLRACSMVFAPAIFNNHWFCYAVDKEQEKMFVLDSLGGHSSKDQKRLDNAMKCRLGELLRILNPKSNNNWTDLAIEYVDLPRQHNGHDCGIYVLKYMETWDGVTKYGDKTMPNYSHQDINDIRRDYVCQWVLHPLNEERQKVLANAHLPGDLTFN